MSLSRNELLGGWQLTSFETRDLSGVQRHPLGHRPRGLILYTADGWMSAQLAPESGGATELDEYIAYGGRFHLDESSGTVHHDVLMSTMPELLAAPQFRQAAVDGDTLTLSATTGDTYSTLVWQRS